MALNTNTCTRAHADDDAKDNIKTAYLLEPLMQLFWEISGISPDLIPQGGRACRWIQALEALCTGSACIRQAAAASSYT